MSSILERFKWANSQQIICVFIVLLVGYGLSVYAGNTDLNSVAVQAEPLTIIVGESEIVSTQLPTVRVAVTDPTVSDVKVLTPYQVMLQGLKVGSTDLIIWAEGEDSVQRWKVRVVLDVVSYKQKLDELFPYNALEVSQSAETLIVKGLLRSADQVAQLRDFLDKTGVAYVDMTSIAGVQQVQLQVRVAEASRKVLRLLTVNAAYSDKNFFGASIVAPSGGTGLFTDLEFTSAGSSWAASPAVTLIAGVPRADFDMLFQALVENQYLKLLANPTLVALSGEEASFLAGGEYPIPVVQSGGGTNTSISVEYREYGIHLKFRPIVLGDGTINLYVAPEVSELTDIGAVVIEGFRIPALVTRKVETTLELKSGQTFAIAGLLKENVSAVRSRIPFLGDLPVLGPLFRSVRYTKDETELIILVTASLVEPMSSSQTLPLPGILHTPPEDWEFYLDGHIEGQKPAKINPADAERLRQYGLDKLMGPGAWESYGQEAPAGQIDSAAKSAIEEK